MSELFTRGLGDLARRLGSGELPAEALAASYLRRIAQQEPQVGAFVAFDPDRLMAGARAADARLAAGRTPGPLHGLPIGVKDIIYTAGLRTAMGSPIYRDFVPEYNAEVVDRLSSAGAFVAGKTVTTEFAFMSPAGTRNPWNLAHSPGGSSSGSAAAVAAGLLPGAIGTQTNGSVIRPAAFCGVVGYKPGNAVLSTEGILPFSTTLDQPGVFARSVEDAALLLAHLAHSRWAITPQVSVLKVAPRLVAVRSPVWERAEEDQRQRFFGDIQALRAAGAQVDETELPGSFGDALKVHRTIMLWEAAALSREVRRHHADQLSEILRLALAEGDAIAGADYERALKKRESWQRDLARFLDGYDALLTPPAAGEAPEAGSTGDPAFCTLWTLLGVPAISIPTGLGRQGLPLGLQIVGNPGESNHLLASALWCERQRPFVGLLGPRETLTQRAMTHGY